MLIDGVSPDGMFESYVEDDGRAVYMYLRGRTDCHPPMASVWVTNRGPAPKDVDVAAMRAGEAPRNPARFCRSTDAASAVRGSQLELVWLPEGEGVSLYSDGELLAAIPSCAPVTGGAPGYALDAAGDGPLARSLERSPAVAAQFAGARAFWAEWKAETTPFERVRDAQLTSLEEAFGPVRRYFAVDAGRWPPRGVASFGTDSHKVLATVGVAVRPMPGLARYTDEPQKVRRIEIGAVLPFDTSEAGEESLVGYLGGQAALPWSQYSFLGHGHTLPCDALAPFGHPAVILASAAATDFPVSLPDVDGDPVTMLWAVPITAAEHESAMQHGSGRLLEEFRSVRLVRMR